MPRINPVTIENAPEASKPVMEQIKANFGHVANIFATLAHSPAALKGLIGLFEALDEGALAGKAHEAIALRIGEFHGCKYCTAAHSIKAKMAGATAEETIAFRKGQSDDPKIQALLTLAAAMVNNRGKLDDADVQAAKDAGLSDGELLETVAIVACNTYTNYINALVLTEVDFPAAPAID
jgi:uncharacterized peroxidase-related enzyme